MMLREEITDILEEMEDIDERIESLQEHPLVSDYRSDDALDMSREYLNEAYQDVAEAGVDS